MTLAPWSQKALLAATLFLTACAGPSLKNEIVRDEPSYSKPRAPMGILRELADTVTAEHGPEYSGFRLLDANYDGLAARLALIDSATSSIDIQTYLWYPDNSGRLLLERAVAAANRGVHVRLLVDDLLTIGLDQVIYELDQRPNMELRLFNPWEKRSTLARGGEMVAQMERLNQRMHDKLLVADGNAAIVGGRNIGDHYFGLSHDYNFHDLDLVGFGHIATQAAGMFDHFWNSEWVVSADNIDVEPDAEFARQAWENLQEKNRNAEELSSFGAEPADWREEFASLAGELHIGTSELVYDTTREDAIEQNVAAVMFPWMNLAQQELLITNAYIIPSQPAIDFLQDLTNRGVSVRILTNSLASHDVPAVNSHYRDWRDDLILAGTELYEMRPDAAIESIVNVPPVQGEFIGLHTKAFVVDREKVFIGSMNFDPRSFNINTEAGAFVHSPGLAEDLARVMERDMQPENAWQVFLDEKGKPYWVDSNGRLDKQPARNSNQRVMDKIFKVIPKEQY
ncbi:MAG: phospholipase D family protein [Xanthomonadales bacterium]|nr:phospholipase D family protein [Xanthomonadales bacterium]